VTQDDVLVGYRRRLFTLADELGNVSRACRLMGVHRSTSGRARRAARGGAIATAKPYIAA
jgi:hypothetical protein